MNNTELDSLAIADLEARYSVNRSNVYKRITCLKEKGYSMQLESQGRKSYVNAEQIRLLDALDRHISSGLSMNLFRESGALDNEPNDLMSYSLARHYEPSRETQDSKAIAKQSSQLIALSPEQLIELATAIAPISPAPASDPFENLEQIDRIYRNGWYVSSSQLAPLLDRQSLPSKDFQMFGYRFTPNGRNGREKAWKVEKLDAKTIDKSM